MFALVSRWIRRKLEFLGSLLKDAKHQAVKETCKVTHYRDEEACADDTIFEATVFEAKWLWFRVLDLLLLLCPMLVLLLWLLEGSDPLRPALFTAFLWELWLLFPRTALAMLSVSNSRALCGLMGCLFRYTSLGRRLQTALRSWSSLMLLWMGLPNRFRASNDW